MDFEIKKTNELSDVEKEDIVGLFNIVFEKDRTIAEFENQCTQNPFGYAFHSLMKKDGKIVGHNAGVPVYYTVSGKRELFINNIDTMIEKDCRGVDNFFDLINNATERYRKEGAAVFYGFPNDNSYPLLTGLGLMEDVGKLKTYALPIKIGGIKPGLKVLNWASNLFCRSFRALSSGSSQVHNFPIEKELFTYNATRYNRSDGKYNIIEKDGFGFSYKIIEYEGVRSAFLIDVWPKSAKNFNKAVKHILKNDSRNFDILLYVGLLPFKGHGLIEVPNKFAPKEFNFTALCLKDELKDTLMNIRNWDVNLSNYDLI